jgi:hypothetical protein
LELFTKTNHHGKIIMNCLKEYLKAVGDGGVSLEDFVEQWMDKLNETSLQIDAITQLNYRSQEKIIIQSKIIVDLQKQIEFLKKQIAV